MCCYTSRFFVDFGNWCQLGSLADVLRSLHCVKTKQLPPSQVPQPPDFMSCLMPDYLLLYLSIGFIRTVALFKLVKMFWLLSSTPKRIEDYLLPADKKLLRVKSGRRAKQASTLLFWASQATCGSEYKVRWKRGGGGCGMRVKGSNPLKPEFQQTISSSCPL